MTVPRAACQLRENAGMLLRRKRRADDIPIGGQVAKKLQADIDPVANADNQLAGQHRIFPQETECNVSLSQLLQEALKPFLRRVSSEDFLQASDMKLQHHCGAQHPEQLRGQISN